MFTKILFATTVSQASDNAAKVAFDLARRNSAQLTLFHVLGVPSRGFSQEVRDVRTGEAANDTPEYRDWVVEEIRQHYETQLAGYPADIRMAQGIPPTEILRLARQMDPDLIVMGAHSRESETGSSRMRSIIGNTMQRVAKAARCPVLIVNRPCNTCWSMFSNIVFATDFSKAADSAFAFAYKTAKAVGAKLYLFHAVDVQSAGMTPDQAEIERQVERARTMLQERYVSKITDYDNFEVIIREGTPYVEVLKVARERQADLIVMAHHAKDVSFDDAEIGTTVEQVVLRSACPVASVTHPDKVTEQRVEELLAAEA